MPNKVLDHWAPEMDDNGLTPPFPALDFEGEQYDLVHLLEGCLQNGSYVSIDMSERKSNENWVMRS